MAKKKGKSVKTLLLDNGAAYKVTDDRGKYFTCGNVKFRKGNPHIIKVEGVNTNADC